jgi:hypothetical protein
VYLLVLLMVGALVTWWAKVKVEMWAHGGSVPMARVWVKLLELGMVAQK